MLAKINLESRINVFIPIQFAIYSSIFKFNNYSCIKFLIHYKYFIISTYYYYLEIIDENYINNLRILYFKTKIIKGILRVFKRIQYNMK